MTEFLELEAFRQQGMPDALCFTMTFRKYIQTAKKKKMKECVSYSVHKLTIPTHCLSKGLLFSSLQKLFITDR